MKKSVALLTVILLLAACLAGCTEAEEPPVVITEPEAIATEPPFSRNGMTFVLPDGFTDYTGTAIAGQETFRYANSDWGLIGFESSKEAEDFEDFSDFVYSYAEAAGCEVQEKDGFQTFTRIDSSLQDIESHIFVFYESEESFWVVKAYCREGVFETYQEEMWKIATSATFE